MNSHNINADHPANKNPHDASPTTIADELEGRELFNRTLLMDFSGFCARCRSKNKRRAAAGINEKRDRFVDGEEVFFIAYWMRPQHNDFRSAPPGYWRISKVICADHPRLPLTEAVSHHTTQVRGEANLAVGDDGHALTNTTVTEVSRVGSGGETTAVTERREKYVVEDPPEEASGIVGKIPVTAPRPEWPKEEREWLERLREEHGPLDSASRTNGSFGPSPRSGLTNPGKL